MKNNYIEFKKERDLGAIISDTFKFIRENYKAYFLTILKIVGPFILLALIAFVFYMFFISDTLSNTTVVQRKSSMFAAKLFSGIFVFFIFFVFAYAAMSMASLYFIKSYIKNKGKPQFSEVLTNVKSNILSYIGLGILITLTVIVGFVLCYFPGVYFGIVLGLAPAIFVFEKKGVGNSFSDAFKLIKGQWWNTFGVVLVVSLLVFILGQAFSVPTIIYQMIKIGTLAGKDNPEAVLGIFKDPIYLGLNVLSYAFQFILYSVTIISSVFIYYDLNEQKKQTGTLEQIEKLGN